MSLFIGFSVNTLREVTFLSTYFTIYEHLKLFQYTILTSYCNHTNCNYNPYNHNHLDHDHNYRSDRKIVVNTNKSGIEMQDFYMTYCAVPVAGNKMMILNMMTMMLMFMIAIIFIEVMMIVVMNDDSSYE